MQQAAVVRERHCMRREEVECKGNECQQQRFGSRNLSWATRLAQLVLRILNVVVHELSQCLDGFEKKESILRIPLEPLAFLDAERVPICMLENGAKSLQPTDSQKVANGFLGNKQQRLRPTWVDANQPAQVANLREFSRLLMRTFIGFVLGCGFALCTMLRGLKMQKDLLRKFCNEEFLCGGAKRKRARSKSQIRVC